jgi:hypothetical protein
MEREIEQRVKELERKINNLEPYAGRSAMVSITHEDLQKLREEIRIHMSNISDEIAALTAHLKNIATGVANASAANAAAIAALKAEIATLQTTGDTLSPSTQSALDAAEASAAALDTATTAATTTPTTPPANPIQPVGQTSGSVAG